MQVAVFAEALLNPDAAVPPGLIDPSGRPAPRRFAVYRNNVAASLTRAMEDGFPIVRRVVGEVFFAAMAVAFLRAHPPRSPILTLYGGDFPAFLAAFPPVLRLGYLPDTARLDLALRHSYHAADSATADLRGIDPDILMRSRLTLGQPVVLLTSDWPIHGIWRANVAGGAAPVMRPESILITRPGFDPEPCLLGPGAGTAIAALMRNLTLAEALDAAPDCDPAALLGLLIQGRAIARVVS